ncbi:MAG: NADP-dependent isocitrate dehydrogenase, partial [Pseudomonadota bacterium]
MTRPRDAHGAPVRQVPDIVRRFAAAAGVSVGTKDISLAGRIIAAFPERLTDAQR